MIIMITIMKQEDEVEEEEEALCTALTKLSM